MTFDLLRNHVGLKCDQRNGFACDCSGSFRTCLGIYSVIHSSNNYSPSHATFNHVSVWIYECVRLNVCVCLCMHELVCVYVMISGVIIGVDSEEINSVRVSICWTAREDSRRLTHTHFPLSQPAFPQQTCSSLKCVWSGFCSIVDSISRCCGCLCVCVCVWANFVSVNVISWESNNVTAITMYILTGIQFAT